MHLLFLFPLNVNDHKFITFTVYVYDLNWNEATTDARYYEVQPPDAYQETYSLHLQMP